MAPSWVSRGPCTQRSGGGRGLTARDAVCVVPILAISGLLVQCFHNIFATFFEKFSEMPPEASTGGLGPKGKSPELGNSGLLHSEKWRWEGTHRQGCCLYWIDATNFRSECPHLFRDPLNFFLFFSAFRKPRAARPAPPKWPLQEVMAGLVLIYHDPANYLKVSHLHASV